MVMTERQGLIVWVHHLRAIRVLERHGLVHYVSRKLHYVVMYVNRDKLQETMAQLEKLNFVKKVELSYRGELRTEYGTVNHSHYNSM